MKSLMAAISSLAGAGGGIVNIPLSGTARSLGIAQKRYT